MLDRDSHSATMRAGSSFGGKYTLERVIGQGGMGIVWEARHCALNTLVAIKVLKRTSAAQAVAQKRFEAEAQITAQLKTRHAVQVFDFGVTDDGQPYLVMERLDGESLAQRLQRVGRIDLGTTAQHLRQAARALDRAHAHGIVHRDFKPENIFITRDEEGREQVKVMDFGVAKLMGELDAVEASPEPGAPISGFTRTGAILGTPCYMAPEQIDSSLELGPRADVWAFGVVAFECVTGKRPFDAGDLASLFDRIRRGSRPHARDLVPELPGSFDVWFDRACSVDPAKRFASAGDAAAALALALGVPTQPTEMRASSPDASLRPPQFTPSETSLDPRAFAPTLEAVEVAGATTRRKPRLVWGALATVVASAIVALSVARSHPGVASAAGRAEAAAPANLPAAIAPLAVAAEASPADSASPVAAAPRRIPETRSTHARATRPAVVVPASQPVAVAPPPAPAPSASTPHKTSAFDLPPLGL